MFVSKYLISSFDFFSWLYEKVQSVREGERGEKKNSVRRGKK